VFTTIRTNRVGRVRITASRNGRKWSYGVGTRRRYTAEAATSRYNTKYTIVKRCSDATPQVYRAEFRIPGDRGVIGMWLKTQAGHAVGQHTSHGAKRTNSEVAGITGEITAEACKQRREATRRRACVGRQALNGNGTRYVNVVMRSEVVGNSR